MPPTSPERPASSPRVAVIGAGISGIAMGVKLQRAGLPFVIFEKAGTIGGTWRDNRYPGLHCDVPGYVYSYSFAREPMSERFMPAGSEIQAYLERVFAEQGLAPHTRFHTEVVSAEWDGNGWTLETRQGVRERFDLIVHATGYLHHPTLPKIEGMERFAGVAVHSARWDDAIEWRGKRVGIIGNGSSGIQLVVGMAKEARHLTSFQRTPQWVFPMPNRRLGQGFTNALRRSPRMTEAFVEMLERYADDLLGTASVRPGWQRKLFGLWCRRHLATVKDPELRRKLTPPDAPLCKRPVMSTRFYRYVQRDNVSLVTDHIERIVPEGVVTEDGKMHPLDVLIYATGFDPLAYMRPMRIVGVDGLTLDRAWKDGPRAYRTLAIPGFPNMFLMLGPHSPLLAVSIHSTVERQADYIVQMAELLRSGRARAIAPTPEAHARWCAEIEAGIPGTVWDDPTCNSWYLDAQRKPILWPFKRARWYRTLHPELGDYRLDD